MGIRCWVGTALYIVVVPPVDILVWQCNIFAGANLRTDKFLQINFLRCSLCNWLVPWFTRRCVIDRNAGSQIRRQRIKAGDLIGVNQHRDRPGPVFPGFNLNVFPSESFSAFVPSASWLAWVLCCYPTEPLIQILHNLHLDSIIRAFRMPFSFVSSAWLLRLIPVGHLDGVLHRELVILGVERLAFVCNRDTVRIAARWLLGLLLAAQRQAQRALLGHALGAILLFVRTGVKSCSNGDRSCSRGICRGRHRCRRKGRADIDLPLGEALVADDGLLVQRHGKAEVGDALRL